MDVNMREDRDRYTSEILDSDSDKKLIVAGPGTGKTFTFERALERVGGGGLALTFVRNLVADLESSLGELAEARTFHSYCKLLLYQNPPPGLEHPIDFYPPLNHLREEDLRFLHPESDWDSDDIEDVLHNLQEDTELFEEVLSLGEYYNSVGFLDSVFRVLRFFRDRPNETPAYNLVVVDEYQDFSRLEKEFIELLARRNPVLIAGDDDQALYEFKHATSRYIQELAADESEYSLFELPYCSRCTQVLVDAFHDVIGVAQARGLLQRRLEKRFECFIPDKEEESEAHPDIIHTHCSVERKASPYMGRYVASQIEKITDEEIAESHAEEETTVLVIGPSYLLENVVGVLLDRYSNVEYPQSRSLDVERIDGYRRLARARDSRLGWRIISYCDRVDDYPETVARALREDRSLGDLVPATYRENHLVIAELVQRLMTDEKLDEAEIDELERATGSDFSMICDSLGIEADDGEADEGDGELDHSEPTILCTTLRGAKGRSAYYVFMVGMNNTHIPRDPDDITDDEVRNFLVGLTRGRRECHLVSCGRWGAQKLDSSEFISWIDRDRIRYRYVDKARLEELEKT